MGEMQDALARGERIEIRGFGVFEKKLKKASVARDIKRGVTLKVPY